jgi:hypothetical protein
MRKEVGEWVGGHFYELEFAFFINLIFGIDKTSNKLFFETHS